MAIEQMRRPNKHTCQPQMKYLTIYCVTMQVNVNLSFTHMLTVTFSALGLHEKDHKKMVPIIYMRTVIH